MDLEYLQSLMGGEEVPAARDYQDIWVVGEMAGGELTPLSAAIVGRARELANALGVYVRGILFGPDAGGAAERMIQLGADSTLIFESPALAEFALEPYLELLAKQIEEDRPEMVLFGDTDAAGELAPRLAARFGGPLFAHCVDLGVDELQRALLATAPRLGGEFFEIVVAPTARPQFATVQPGALPMPFADEGRAGEVEMMTAFHLPPARVQIEGESETPSTPAPLREARVIVCAGRGLSDEAGLKLAGDLAAALGGQLAGTRGALDEGWIPAERVIGMGGVSVRPRLYVACGVSGAIQHVLGIEKADFVLAINDDPEAEIFQYADAGIVGDAKEVAAALLGAWREPVKSNDNVTEGELPVK